MNAKRMSQKIGLALLFLWPIIGSIQFNLSKSSMVSRLLTGSLLLLSLVALGFKLFEEKNIRTPQIIILSVGVITALSILFYQLYSV